MAILFFIPIALFGVMFLWHFLRGIGVRRLWSVLCTGALAVFLIALIGGGSDDHHH